MHSRAGAERKREARTEPKRRNTGGSPSLSEHSVYAALLAIGRKDRRLHWRTLRQYGAILSCPAVEYRAGSEASTTERAKHAESIIRETITEIDDDTTRAVAHAALCARDEFAGKLIDARLELLPGITLDIFKYRRRQAFDTIVNRLQDAVIAGVPPSNAPHLTMAPAVKELAEVSAKMYFIGLTMMCARDYDWYCPKSCKQAFLSEALAFIVALERCIRTPIQLDTDDPYGFRGYSAHLSVALQNLARTVYRPDYFLRDEFFPGQLMLCDPEPLVAKAGACMRMIAGAFPAECDDLGFRGEDSARDALGEMFGGDAGKVAEVMVEEYIDQKELLLAKDEYVWYDYFEVREEVPKYGSRA